MTTRSLTSDSDDAFFSGLGEGRSQSAPPLPSRLSTQPWQGHCQQGMMLNVS